MIEAWIIEKVKEKERLQREIEEERPFLYIEDIPEKPKEKKEEKSQIIIIEL